MKILYNLLLFLLKLKQLINMKQTFLIILTLFFVAFTSAQNIDVSGNVQDNTGFPLPGVNVIVKNTSKGVVTDFDGNFTISGIEVGSTISVSYIGYLTKEIVIANNSKLTIQLEEDLAQLDEVVVVGYGTQKKKEVTGAVSVIDSEAIEKLNPQRVEQALQGQIAGVNVTSSSGSPGSGSNIRIRGITTNGDNAPLILVDGNVITDLSVINPNDIKSMNVLKDATAGIYGVRGANGVILITTKTGRKNSELKFQVDAYTGFQTTSQKIDVLKPLDFAIYVNDYLGETEYAVYPQEGTDWQDEVFQTAAISNVNFSGSGGTEKAAYTFGVSRLDQDGIVGASKSNYTRNTLRLGFNYDILDNLKLSTTALVTNSKKNNLPENGNGSPLYQAVNINPDMPVYDENGDFALANDIASIEIINPLAQIANIYNTTKIDKYSGTIGLDYTFLEDFTVSSKFQINYANVLNDVFNPIVDYGDSKGANRPANEVVDNVDLYVDYTWDNFINYSTDFGGEDHSLNALLGMSVFRTRGHFWGYTGTILKNGSNSASDALVNGWIGDRVEGIITPRINDAAKAVGGDQFDSRLSSTFSRLQYSYKGKYLLSGVIRRDVSSKFSSINNNNIGYFPSGSIGWNISDEDFMQDSKWINSLKFRASYGIIGSDKIPDFAFITRLNGEATVDPGGSVTTQDDLLNGVAAGSLGNLDLKWEEQVTANIGFDARLFNNKISITTDIFQKETEDLLIRPQSSATTGVGGLGSSDPVINAGTVQNRGIEFKIGYDDNFSEDFKFNISYNVTVLENEVTSLNGLLAPTGGEYGVGLSQTGISRMVPGLPLGYFHGYKTDGIYQTQAEIDALNANATDNDGVYHAGATAGELKFVDTNGNGYIDDGDRTNLGDPIPEVTMGLNLGFSYKNLDFSANAFASIGNDMIRDYERIAAKANRGTYMLDRWQGTGTSNTVPLATSEASISSSTFSDFMVEDASFVRLQNVQLGYTIQDALENTGIDKIRIYLSGNNLITITDYKGFDPSASSGGPIGNGIDKGFYPVASTYLLGVNLSF